MRASPKLEHLEQLRNEASGERSVRRLVRGRALHGCRAALLARFGERGLGQVAARLPGDAIAYALDRELAFPEWLPEAHLAAWCDAVFEGPANRDRAALRAFVSCLIDESVGRAHRLLLQIATPHGIVRRIGELWRDDFTHGRLVAYATSPSSALLTLHEHAFTENACMRDVVAEAARHLVELAGAREVVEKHDDAPAPTLAVSIEWR